MRYFIAFMLAIFIANTSAHAASTTGTASATVVNTPITVTQTTPLSFGSFSSNAAGSITSTGNTSGGVTKITNGNNALFTVTGQPNTAYTVSDSEDSVTLTGPNNMTMVADLTYPTNGLTLNSSGSNTFNVSGALVVGANRPVGNYTGSYPVVVNY